MLKNINKKMILILLLLMFHFVISAQSPPVYLNHLYFVLDEKTYQEIGKSDFIKNEFAEFRVRTTVADKGKTWTGSYLFGEVTYIEIFEESPNYPLNKTGLAFGVEQIGASEIYFQKLKKSFPAQATKILRTRTLENKSEAPWFYSVNVDFKDDKATLFPWLMEYHKDALQKIFPDLKPEENGITRKKYLARRYNENKLFHHLSEITLVLNQTESSRLIKQLEAFNFKKIKAKNEITIQGNDLTIFIIPAKISKGITELKIDLLREKQGQKEYKFCDKVTLKFLGKTAIWTFSRNE